MRYLVLCGGGSRGAIEVGFVTALWEHGVQFDGIVGSSVGALNGAFLAAGGRPSDLADIWRHLRFGDCFRFNWRTIARGVREPSLFTLGGGLRQLVRGLGAQCIEDLAQPFVAVATDLATGEPVALDRGPLEPALRASIALPGLLPPVTIAGRCLVDGSLSANLPVAEAVRRGATEIWAMRCACCANPHLKFDRLPTILAQVFGLAVDRGAHREAVALSQCTSYVWELDAGLHVSSLDFQQGALLIEQAYHFTRERLGAVR